MRKYYYNDPESGLPLEVSKETYEQIQALSRIRGKDGKPIGLVFLTSTVADLDDKNNLKHLWEKSPSPSNKSGSSTT